MQHYKAPDNSLHVIEPEFEHLLPAGCVAITEEEAEALRPKPNPADVIRAQIKAIELAELTPRNTREALIYLAEKEAIAVASQLGVTPEQVLAANIGYQNAKAVDLQITALRAQIQALS